MMKHISIYEDHIRIKTPDKSIKKSLLSACLDTEYFEEVVQGLEEICLKFDPVLFQDADIIGFLSQHIKSSEKPSSKRQHHDLNIIFNDDLDLDFVCAKMKMSPSQFIDWFVQQNYQVEMMGFQPGFAYLSHEGKAPTIERLSIPRSKVTAGSIGFLGSSACIYAHDGPGGWPIIGNITKPIFNTEVSPPNLLQSGDTISFILS